MTANAAHQSLVVTPESVTTAGAVTYWRLSGATKLSRLADAWTNRGLDATVLPKPVSDPVALGRAVADQQFGRDGTGRRRFVSPLKHGGQWAIVEESLRDGVLTYRTLVTAAFVHGAPRVDAAEATPAEHDSLRVSIFEGYEAQRSQLNSNDVSSWLVKLAHGQRAVALRDSGGIYFVPRTSMDVWNAAAEALESIGAHYVFRIPAMRNDEAVRAIVDAVTEEAAQALRKMEEELSKTGDEALGARALRNRQVECSDLLDKVAAYEELLGVALPKITEGVEALRATVVAAALLAESEP